MVRSGSVKRREIYGDEDQTDRQYHHDWHQNASYAYSPTHRRLAPFKGNAGHDAIVTATLNRLRSRH
jgi:hypothetical protein